MAMTPRVVVGGLAIALVATLSACQGGSADSADPTPPATASPTSPTPEQTSPSPSSTSVSPTDDASALAVALVPKYLKTIDDLFIDPTLSLNRLHEVTTASEFKIEVATVVAFRRKGYVQSGSTKLVTTSVRRVNLARQAALRAPSRVPTVSVTACVDVSGVQVVDAKGRSVVPAGRPRFLIEHLTVTNRSYPDPTGWRVSDAPNKQAGSCSG